MRTRTPIRLPLPVPGFAARTHQLTLYSVVGSALVCAWLLATLLLATTLRVNVDLRVVLLILGLALTWYLILFGVSVVVVCVQDAIYASAEEVLAALRGQAEAEEDR